MDLKQLQTRKSQLQAEVNRLQETRTDVNVQLVAAKNKVDKIQVQIDHLTSEIVVSEHAILRYLERAKGIDIEEAKKAILSEQTKAQIKELGSGKYPIGQGLRAIVKKNVVVTVEPI